jgi:hypothetical protein
MHGHACVQYIHASCVTSATKPPCSYLSSHTPSPNHGLGPPSPAFLKSQTVVDYWTTPKSDLSPRYQGFGAKVSAVRSGHYHGTTTVRLPLTAP